MIRKETVIGSKLQKSMETARHLRFSKSRLTIRKMLILNKIKVKRRNKKPFLDRNDCFCKYFLPESDQIYLIRFKKKLYTKFFSFSVLCSEIFERSDFRKPYS